MYESYNGDFYKKLEWFGYIDKQRSDANFIKNIKAKYGSNITIIIGDWSETMAIKRISMPGKHLRRLLAAHFPVYLLDEFNTSKLNHVTEEACENLELVVEINGENKSRRLHSVLTYKMQNGRKGCINRDINAVKNMRKIVKSLMEGKGRPAKIL